MRRPFLLFACVSIALGSGIACATSDDGPSDPGTPADGDGGLRLDAGPRLDAGADVTADAYREPPTCSRAGWCLTQLPEDQLQLRDIWPFPNRAFAIADSDTVGTKVLEWDGATNTWSYIDDNNQNTGYSITGSTWAPNENEVYYSRLVVDFSNFSIQGIAYHGKRPIPPATDWTWETLPAQTCDRINIPIVRGTGPDDVYFVFCNSVFLLNQGSPGDGGTTTAWGLKYTVEGDTSNVTLTDIVGTGPDDLWIVGGRTWAGYGGCGFVVRKDASGYKVVADGDADTDTGACTAREGLARIPGPFQYGNQIPDANQFVGVTYVSDRVTDVTKIVEATDGTISQTTSHPTVGSDILLNSAWGASLDNLWFVTGRLGNGANTVLHGTNVFSDNGTYQYSTVSMNGEPNPKRLVRIRGTSNTNIWAIGDQRALHKTTP